VLGPVTGGACEIMHREEGVRFYLRTVIESVDAGAPDAPDAPDAQPLRCRLSSGDTLECDAILVGIGAAPSLGWLDGSGLAAGPDGIVCDASLLAGPGIVVAGDVARWPLPLHAEASAPAPAPAQALETIRVEHRTNAAEQGGYAAQTLLAHLGLAPAVTPTEEPSYAVPYVWSDQYNVKIQVLGLPRPDDEVVVVEGDPADRRFVALHGRGGRLVGVVGFARPRHVMSLRPLLDRAASLEEAASLFG
jgi:3-phenylpropionate/trans-cinnamate dioxygenase ferredoxin reductase subunit